MGRGHAWELETERGEMGSAELGVGGELTAAMAEQREQRAMDGGAEGELENDVRREEHVAGLEQGDGRAGRAWLRAAWASTPESSGRRARAGSKRVPRNRSAGGAEEMDARR